jgi:hypothetical protein
MTPAAKIKILEQDEGVSQDLQLRDELSTKRKITFGSSNG